MRNKGAPQGPDPAERHSASSMKRVYKSATIAPSPEGWRVLLDDHPVRTPAGAILAVSREAVAQAIAEEWNSQKETVRPATMPVMQFVCTALDRIPGLRAQVVDSVAAYGRTDLLCYRAEHPAELADRQNREWQPLFDWAALRYDAPLSVVVGMMPVPQPEGAQEALRRAVEALDDFALVGLQTAVADTGSLVMGLALLEGRIDAEAAFRMSLLDELYQEEQWGTDEEAKKRQDGLLQSIAATEKFMRLIKGER